MKTSITLLKWCIYCWLAILVSRSIAEVLLNYNSLGTCTNYTMEISGTFIIFSLTILTFKFNSKLVRTIDQIWHHNLIFKRLKPARPWSFCKLLANFSLLIVFVFLVNSLVVHGGRTLAIALGISGNYKFGEYIYAVTASYDGSALASLLAPLRPSTNQIDLELDRLNNTVALIYGKDSKQMAKCYYALGCDYYYFADYSNAERYIRKAIAIYQADHELTGRVWPLVTLSAIQYKTGQDKVIQKTLDEGLRLAPYCTEHLLPAYQTFNGISFFSNNNDETIAFREITKEMQVISRNKAILSFLLHWSGLDKSLFLV